MKNWYIELLVNYNGELVNPCGTDYAMLYDDLKTLRGVLNRMKKWMPFDGYMQKVVGFKIYNYSNLYDDSTHTLVFEAYEGDYIFDEILDAQKSK